MKPTSRDPSRRRNVVILGGGVSALVAAFKLTERERWYEDYSITIYQQGWRLGGKGASGRNRQAHDRIEEHGLHMWWGFYDQAFSIMAKCEEILADPTVGLSALFSPQSSIGFIETIEGTTYQRVVEFPKNDAELGGEPREFGVTDYTRGISRWCQHLSNVLRDETLTRVLPDSYAPIFRLGIHRHLLRQLAVVFSSLAYHHDSSKAGASLVSKIVQLLTSVVLPFPSEIEHAKEPQPAQIPSSHRALLHLLKHLRASLRHPNRICGADDFDAHWYYVWLDFLLTAACGLLQDGVLAEWPNFASLDEEELTSWLVRHGIDQEVTLSSALVRGLYDAAFCFIGGNPQRPAVSTAVIIRVFLRMFLCYKGAYMWRMNGGMGDVIFATIYRALMKKNELAERLGGHPDSIRVEFFHRVDQLGLSDDKSTVNRIEITRQATIKEGPYRPLIRIPNCPHPVWSTEPDYEQLCEGAALRTYRDKHPSTCPLESRFSDWPGVERRTLFCGKDFDLVVLGIPIAGLTKIASELVSASQRWADMVAQIKTIRTQAAQIWLTKTPGQLGWCSPDLSVIAGYVDPLNSLAEMSQVLPVEGWSSHTPPRSLIYFCGPMPDDPAEPEEADPLYPATQVEITRETLIETLRSHADKLWPQSRDSKTNEFDWQLLVAPAQLDGPARVSTQYVRSNIDPSERYVLALPGTAKYRLAPGNSGFDNLVLAGDWTHTELGFGCVEAATQSGVLAAEAVIHKQLRVGLSTQHAQKAASKLPLYRRPFSEQAFRPPYSLRGASFQVHVLAAPEFLLQRSCDHYLNRTKFDRHFAPLGPFVLLMLGYVESNRAILGPESGFGDGPESSAAIVMPVIRKHEDQATIGLFPICAVVDNSLSLATGRELFGFSKQIGWFQGDLRTASEAVSVETLVFERHHPKTRLCRRRWLGVTAPTATPQDFAQEIRPLTPAIHPGLFDLMQGLLGLRSQADNSRATAAIHATDRIASLVQVLRSRQLSVYNLLQIRDADDPERARLQRVTRSQLSIEQVHSVQLLHGCQVELCAFDSHPVASELLGLPHQDHVITPLHSVWARYDAQQSQIIEEIDLGEPTTPHR